MTHAACRIQKTEGLSKQKAARLAFTKFVCCDDTRVGVNRCSFPRAAGAIVPRELHLGIRIRLPVARSWIVAGLGWAWN